MRSTILRDERASVLITAQRNTKEESRPVRGRNARSQGLLWLSAGLRRAASRAASSNGKSNSPARRRFPVRVRSGPLVRAGQVVADGGAVGSARASGARGRRFEPGPSDDGSLAHREERLSEGQQARGSSPRGTTTLRRRELYGCSTGLLIQGYGVRAPGGAPIPGGLLAPTLTLTQARAGSIPAPVATPPRTAAAPPS